MNQIEKKDRRSSFGITAVIILTLYSITIIGALLWALNSSLKARLDFRANLFGLPKKFMFGNFISAFHELSVPIEKGAGTDNVYLWGMIFNSLLIAVVPVTVRILTTAICSYTIAKYNFRGKQLIYNIIIIVMIMPIVGNLPSAMQISKAIGFYDKIWATWLTSGVIWTSDFLILYAVYKGIPWDYAEAALIDGATDWQVYWKIMIQLSKTTILVLVLIGFIASWNDYNTSLIWLPSYPSLAYGLYYFQFSNSQIASSITIQLSACSISILPIFIVFMIFKDKMMGCLTMGGLKG